MTERPLRRVVFYAGVLVLGVTSARTSRAQQPAQPPPPQQGYPQQQQQYPQQQQQYPQQQQQNPQQQQQYPQQQQQYPQQQQQYPQQQGYDQQGYQQQGYGQQGYEPPPPPRRREEDESPIPDFSIRADALNFLIWGRLGLPLEVQLYKFMTFQLVPVFVTSTSPPAFNFSGREDNLTQHSDGLGSMSGASFGVGFWFSGKPHKGTVLRAVYTHYAYKYKTTWDGETLDQVTFTEKRLLAQLGGYSRFGAFIIGGVLELGMELNDKTRCLDEDVDNCDELEIEIEPNTSYPLQGGLHPVVLQGTLELGVAF